MAVVTRKRPHESIVTEPLAALEDSEPTLELRRRSMALLTRALSAPAPFVFSAETASPSSPSSPPKTSKDDLAALRAGLLSIREGATPQGIDKSRALDYLNQLCARSVSLGELKSSEIGKEVNQRFWREHCDTEIAGRCNALVAYWKTALAAREKDLAPLIWKMASDAAVATRCAQDVEAAVWTANGPSDELLQSDVFAIDHLRLYKSKIRFLVANLRKNADLRKQALEGRLTGRDIAERHEDDFLSEDRLHERKKDRENAMKAVLLHAEPHDFFDELLSCRNCSHVGCRYRIVRDSWALPRCTGNGGMMRKDTGRVVSYECPSCGEQWTQEGMV